MTEASPQEFLPPYSRPVTAVTLAVAVAAAMAVFTIFPALDLIPAAYFYMPGPVPWDNSAWYCRGYALACQPTLVIVREFLHVLPLFLGGLLFVATVWIAVKRRSIIDGLVLRCGAAFWSLVISNLLVVDFLLKQHWGRPRPYHQYIGEARFSSHQFVAAGDWRGACESNCSFVSGEANALFWMVCATAILPASIRRPAFFIALILATGGSLLRVAFGAHYLSDVIVGGLLAALIFSLIALLVSRLLRQDRTGAASINT